MAHDYAMAALAAILATGCLSGSDESPGGGGGSTPEPQLGGAGGSMPQPSAAGTSAADGGSGAGGSQGPSSVAGAGAGSGGAPVMTPNLPAQCLLPTAPCANGAECCDGRACDMTSLGRVCCGNEGAACTTENGEDCCGDLLCVDGACTSPLLEPLVCEAPCKTAPALALERSRLETIGGSFLGSCGDVNHTYGYHVPAANLPASDYSLEGAENDPVCEWYSSAIDIGMDWPAARDWLHWLIEGIQTKRLRGIPEVIGSYDGVNVRYWSDSRGWSTNGVPYTGSGHDTWTHVSIHRSTAHEDHRILAGWTATGMR
jgi:hypothetical protein